MRPIDPSDRAGLAQLFERLSSRSRYRRFLTPKPTLSPRELNFLTDVDHVTHEALVAVDLREGAIVGVARYVHDGGDGSAEIAVEVADDVHNQGIGSALVDRTIARAAANGFARLTAMTLWENAPARSLMRRFGFRPVAANGPTISLELAL
jgi:RimJ/RimL family protein N-acetyltransferase